MVPEVIWLKGARITFDNEITYLSMNFDDWVVLRFIDIVFKKIDLLKMDPRIGKPSTKKANFYKTVVNERIVLIYKFKPRKKEIELIVFWNTLQNPKRLKF